MLENCRSSCQNCLDTWDLRQQCGGCPGRTVNSNRGTGTTRAGIKEPGTRVNEIRKDGEVGGTDVGAFLLFVYSLGMLVSHNERIFMINVAQEGDSTKTGENCCQPTEATSPPTCGYSHNDRRMIDYPTMASACD